MEGGGGGIYEEKDDGKVQILVQPAGVGLKDWRSKYVTSILGTFGAMDGFEELPWKLCRAS
jgi:hypothetical protein